MSQFVGVWQTTGGSGSWQCGDGTSGDKQVTAGEQYTIGAGATQDLMATTSGGCTALLDVSGKRATGDSVVCQGQPSSGLTLTLVVSDDVLTWTQVISWTDSHGNCSETDTILLARAAGN